MKYNAVLFDYAQTLAGKTIAGFGIADFVKSLIPALFESGYRLAVVSNSDRHGDARWLRKSLADVGLIQYFECIFGSGGALGPCPDALSSEGTHKPDPLIYHRVCTFLGVPYSKCVFVGDSKKCDVEMPEKLGMTGLLVDVSQDYRQMLWKVLDDSPRRRNHIVSYKYVADDMISTKIKYLTEELSVGDHILVGTREAIVYDFGRIHEKKDILDTSGVGNEWMTIQLKFISSSPENPTAGTPAACPLWVGMNGDIGEPHP